MTHFFEKHTRLVKKDQELQKLFEAADRRRKLLLQSANNKTSNTENESDSNVNYLLRPLRSTENLIKTDKNDNKVIKY